MYAVALDTTLDDDLVLEGVARELVRALNDLRKAQGLALSDRIRVQLESSGRVDEAARRHGEWIAGEVLAVDWQVGASVDEGDSEALVLDETPGRVRLEVVERN